MNRILKNVIYQAKDRIGCKYDCYMPDVDAMPKASRVRCRIVDEHGHFEDNNKMVIVDISNIGDFITTAQKVRMFIDLSDSDDDDNPF